MKRLTRLICAAASVILLLVVVNNSNNKTNKDIHIPPLLRQIPQYLWSHKSERTIILIRGKTSVGAAGGRRILIQTVGKNNNRRRQMFYRSHEPLMYQPSDPNNKQILLNSVHHHLRNQHSLLRLGRRPLQDIQAVQTVDLKDRPYGYQPETHLRRGGSANNNWFSTEPISPIQAIQTIELDFGTMTAGAPVQAIQTLRITGNPATVLPSSSAAERNYPPAEVQTGLQNLNPSSPMIGMCHSLSWKLCFEYRGYRVQQS